MPRLEASLNLLVRPDVLLTTGQKQTRPLGCSHSNMPVLAPPGRHGSGSTLMEGLNEKERLRNLAGEPELPTQKACMVTLPLLGLATYPRTIYWKFKLVRSHSEKKMEKRINMTNYLKNKTKCVDFKYEMVPRRFRFLFSLCFGGRLFHVVNNVSRVHLH